MNKEKMKKTCITLVGAFAGNLSILGLYPFGIAYLTSGYLGNIYRFLLFPIILVSMSFRAAPLQVAKYGICMVVVMVMIGLVEKIHKKCPIWLGALFAGVTIGIMEVLDYLLQNQARSQLIQGIAEAALVLSLTVIFSRILDEFLTEETELEEPVVISYNPGREKIEESAKAFRNLANTFYGMPSKKESFTKEDLDHMVQEVADEVCMTCEKVNFCWRLNYSDTYKTTYDIWDEVEQNGDKVTEDVKMKLEENCIQSDEFLEESKQIFKRAKLNLIWNNRLIESREAVADQLNEMAGIIDGVAEEVYDAPVPSQDLESRLARRLKLAHITVQKITVLERKGERDNFQGKTEVHVTMRTTGNRCIATKELEHVISRVCGKRMVSSKDSRAIVNREYCTIVFVDDVNFKTLYGVARATKSQESISGDNFSFQYAGSGELIMSLSDGMGSGIHAYKESALVVDLLEQFLEAGFKKETAVKMINSSLVMRADNPYFSTIDISSIDLYNGVCDFLKVGASTTFIKRDSWVETISSTSLPAGVFHKVDFETVSKKLYDGDFVVMVTDGVLDSLPIDNQEIIIQDIIMDIETNNPKQMASQLMKKILSYTDEEPVDDMTILVTGIWKK